MQEVTHDLGRNHEGPCKQAGHIFGHTWVRGERGSAHNVLIDFGSPTRARTWDLRIRQYGRVVEAKRPVSGDVGCAASRAELHAENESSANNEETGHG